MSENRRVMVKHAHTQRTDIIPALETAKETIQELNHGMVEGVNSAIWRIEQTAKEMDNRNSSCEYAFLVIAGLVLLSGVVLSVMVMDIWLFILIDLPAFIIIVLINKILEKTVFSRQRQRYEIEAKEYKENELPIPVARKAELEKSAAELMESDEFIQTQQLIPGKYFDPYVVEKFIEFISSGRANTLKEAINLYETFLYQNKMQDLQAEQIRLQSEQIHLAKQSLDEQKQHSDELKKQSASLGQIAKDTGTTATASSIGAFMSTITALNTRDKKSN